MAKKDKNETVPPIEINTKTTIGTAYSQVASVTVSNIDITIEFAYVNPRNKRGEVVARVTMPRIAGESLAKVIANTVEQHESLKKRKK